MSMSLPHPNRLNQNLWGRDAGINIFLRFPDDSNVLTSVRSNGLLPQSFVPLKKGQVG